MSADNTLAGSEIQLTDRLGEEEVDVGIKDFPPTQTATNMYVGKRNFIHQLMDVALLMANVSQLKALLSIPTDDKYYYLLFVFICMSILLQVTFTICMLVIWSIEKKLEDHLSEPSSKEHPKDKSRQRLAEGLDKLGNVLVLMIIVSNVFITGFGVEAHDSGPDNTNNVTPRPNNGNGSLEVK